MFGLPLGAADQLVIVPEAIFAAPAEVPVNSLVPATSPTRVVGFRGQPRVANDGTWFGLYGFQLPPGAGPLDYTRDTVMLRNGAPYIREGLQVPNSPVFAPIADQSFSQQPFFDVSIAGDGTVAQIIKGTDAFTTLPDGTPNPNDLDFPTGQRDLLVLDRTVVAAVGDEWDVLPGVVFPRNAIESLSTVKAVGTNRLIVKTDLDTGPGRFDPDTTVIVDIVNPGQPNQILTRRFTTEDTLPLPDLGFNLSSLNSNEEDIDANADGSILVGVDIEGEPFNTDGGIVYYDAVTDSYELIAREGAPSPLAGRVYDSLFNNPVVLNDAGDIAFLASVSGSSADDGLLIVNGAIVAREAMPVGTAVPGALQLGFANANIEMDAAGNIIWYGAWNERKENLCPDNPDISSTFAIFEGIFFNDRLLIEGGVTEVHDVNIDGAVFPTLVVKDLPNTGFAGFHVSPDGRWLVVNALLAEPSPDICTFSINNNATPVASVLLRIDLSQIDGGRGDVDRDGDIDFADYVLFETCLAGPDITTPPTGCEPADFAAADLDQDEDVDSADAALFQIVFGD